MIPPDQIKEFRRILDESVKPLFLFDDDPDGICSFIQLYKYAGKGIGVIAKASPVLPEMYVHKIRDYSPDIVFVLDKPRLSHEFIEHCRTPIVWLDHHPPQEVPPDIRYFNPRLLDAEDGRPTSYWCYKVARQHLWIAMTGVLGDWQLTDLAKEFSKQHPDLLPPEFKEPQEALYKSPLGKFARLISFVVKGRVSEAMNCVKILIRIESPHEVLEQTTPRGRYLYSKYLRVKKEYDQLLKQADACASDERLLLFTYTEQNTSFTSELSNELVYRHPDKVILICRSRGDEMKCSLRSTDVDLHKMVERCLVGLEGYGGGHEHACGACVKNHDWGQFLERLREELATPEPKNI